jgi:SAM-dependent methyltransferase
VIVIRNSYFIKKELNFQYSSIADCRNVMDSDMQEIDNPDKHAPSRLNYLDRLKLIIMTIQTFFPNPKNILVGDFACCQGNIGLCLAELGYNVWAIDINPVFVEYSKKKYEKGNIQWIVSEISTLEMTSSSLDIAIAGEVIEHCAYPEQLIKEILKFVRVGGYLLLTTPNGSKIINRLPTFTDVQNKSKRKKFENLQFGPSGKDHLFLFKLEDIKLVTPIGTSIEECGYCGGTVLYNKITQPVMKIMPVRFLEVFCKLIAEIPIVNRTFCSNIYALLKKEDMASAFP